MIESTHMIRCDHPECTRSMTLSGHVTSAQAEQRFEQAGWLCVRGKGPVQDYCPEHAGTTSDG